MKTFVTAIASIQGTFFALRAFCFIDVTWFQTFIPSLSCLVYFVLVALFSLIDSFIGGIQKSGQ